MPVKKDKDTLTFHPIYPSMRSKERNKTEKHNARVLQESSNPSVVMHVAEEFNKTLEANHEFQQALNPVEVNFDAPAEEERVAALGVAAVKTFNEALKKPSRQSVVQLGGAMIQLLAASTYVLDAANGARNNTGNERDTSAPEQPSASSSSVTRKQPKP